MQSPQTLSLPVVMQTFDLQNEQITRRTIEQYVQFLRSDIVTVRDKTDKPSSLALRRHQFLLMGAS